jgi:hypothetical protein
MNFEFLGGEEWNGACVMNQFVLVFLQIARAFV